MTILCSREPICGPNKWWELFLPTSMWVTANHWQLDVCQSIVHMRPKSCRFPITFPVGTTYACFHQFQHNIQSYDSIAISWLDNSMKNKNKNKKIKYDVDCVIYVLKVTLRKNLSRNLKFCG